MHELPPGCLDGIRVVDLTTILMGPLGTRILGDLGADVIRIETLQGDSLRNSVPARSPGMSGILLNVHRNKRSVSLDLKSDNGRKAALAIIDSADVVVTNMRRSALARLGLDPGALRRRKPELLVCVANGYGSSGPYADRPAYDDAIQAGSGLSWLVGQVNERPGYLPTIIADKVCGMVIAQAVLAGLVHRYRTGQGQDIEVPMLETMVAFNLLDHQRGHVYDPPIGDFGYERLLSPYRRPVRTADGWAGILPYADQQWQAFFRVAKRPDLAEDPRFSTHNNRIANINELYRLLDELAAMHTTEQWQALCDANSIPMSPVLDLPHAAEDPHLAAVGLFQSEVHPTEGAYRNVAEPVRYQHAPAGLRRHAPRLGEHTVEVLTEVGVDPGVIRSMLGNNEARSSD